MRFLLRTQGETSCVRCDRVIADGEVYVERDSIDAKNKPVRLPLHPECALDVDTIGAAQALDRFDQGLFGRSDLGFEGRAAFAELATTRTIGIAHRRGQKCTRVSDPSIGAYRVHPPSRPRIDEPSSTSPAMDLAGRPRVRVLVAGSACSTTRTSGRTLQSLLPARSWASPKREYVFVTETSAFEFPDDDPAQPIVGTLYMPIATTGSVVEGAQDVSEWSAFGAPAPILWLIGVSSNKPRDEHTIRFRELMDHFGYDGDECAVLCAPKITRAALDQLVLAMDERFDGSEVRAPENPWAALAERLRSDIRDRIEHRYKGPHLTLGHRLAPLQITHDRRSNAITDECASMLLDRRELELAAMLLCGQIVMDRLCFERWLEQWWTDTGNIYSFSPVIAAFERLFSESGVGLLLRLAPKPFVRITPFQLSQLFAVLRWQSSAEDLPAIRQLLADGADDAVFEATVRRALEERGEQIVADQDPRNGYE